MTVTDAEYRELRYRVEQQGRRIQQLEQTKHFVSANGSFTVFDSTGDVAVRMGKLTDPDDHDIEVRTSTGGYVRLEDLISPQAASASATILVDTTAFSTASGGPSVTVNIGPTHRALVTITGTMQLTTDPQNVFIGYKVTGASTIAASENFSISHGNGTGGTNSGIGTSGTFLQTGLSSGSNVFTATYKSGGVVGSTGAFARRHIVVQPY